NVGLVKAAKRFDETRGFKFISYAVWWIRQAILQAIAEQSRVVRLPLNKIGDINKIKKASIHLEQKFQRIPTAAEIAQELDFSEAKVKSSLKNSTRSLSMDAPFQEGENDNNLYDVLSSGESPNPDKSLLHESLRIEINRALDTLAPREADRSEEHTSELQSRENLVCRLLLEKKKIHISLSLRFVFNTTPTTDIYTLSLHDALPIFFPWMLPSKKVRMTIIFMMF